MTLFADTPSLGMLIGLPFAGLLLIVCVAAVVTGVFMMREIGEGLGLIAGGGAGALVVLVATGLAMWPWKHEFHFWTPVEGKVERISKRLIADGDGGMSERFVVVINGRPYGVDDTRASLLRTGDTIHLRCKREFDFGSDDHGWGCKWGQS